MKKLDVDKLVLFDFDGTMIEGDSTRLAYECLYCNKLSFFMSYYLVHFRGLFFLIFTGKDNEIRESRRIFLATRFENIMKSDFLKKSSERLYASVYRQAANYAKKNYKLVIVSAGYSEIIRFVIGDDLEYDLIANSLFEKNPEMVNHENKVAQLNLKYKSAYFVEAAYGNTQGDVPMLRLARKAFVVSNNGRISDFID